MCRPVWKPLKLIVAAEASGAAPGTGANTPNAAKAPASANETRPPPTTNRLVITNSPRSDVKAGRRALAAMAGAGGRLVLQSTSQQFTAVLRCCKLKCIAPHG